MVLTILKPFSIVLGPEKCQNFDFDFKKKLNFEKRHFSASFAKRVLHNGTVVEREWLIFSPQLEAVLCFVCKLFGTHSQNIESFRTDGFNDWKHYKRAFESHEQSRHHIQNYLAYRNRAKEADSINTQIFQQEQTELKYWREILYRIVSVIKFLASRGLAFRGTNETFGSSSNGNFLGILEVLSEHDALLAAHIEKYGNKGRGIKKYFIFRSNGTTPLKQYSI